MIVTVTLPTETVMPAPITPTTDVTVIVVPDIEAVIEVAPSEVITDKPMTPLPERVWPTATVPDCKAVTVR